MDILTVYITVYTCITVYILQNVYNTENIDFYQN